MNPIEMRRRAAELLNEADAIRAAAESGGRALTDDEVGKINGLAGESEGLMARAEALERLARQRAAVGAPARGGQSGERRGEPEASKFSILRMLRGIRTGNWRGADAEHEFFATVNESDAAAGGYLVPDEVSAEIIELLTAQTAIIEAGARVIPMNSNTMLINKITDGTTVEWLAEEEEATSSAPKFGQVRLTTKKAAAFVPLSNESLADTNGEAERIIREDISRALARALDLKAMFGGGGKEPTGLKNTTGVTAAAGGVAIGSLAFSHTQAVKKKVRLEDAEFTGWVMHPEIWEQMNTLVDSDLRPLLVSSHTEGNAMRLHGYPVRETSQAKITTTGYIFGGNWRDVLVGMRNQIAFAISDQYDFKKDRTWIRAIMRCDVNIRHPESIVYQTVTGLTA